MKKAYRKEIVLWEIVFPLFVYYFMHLLIMIIARDFIGGENEKYMSCQIIADLITIPVIYFMIYRKCKNIVNVYEPSLPKRIADIVMIVVIFVSISWGVNNVIVMSPLVQMSPGFEQANEGFYGSVLGIELIGSGLLAPVLEELVFRGIVYGSLRKITGMWPSVFISALLFGLVHFNIVQLIYALMLGIVLALAMEYVGNAYGAIVGHMAANTFAVLRTELNLGMELTNQSFFAWIVSVCILFLGIGLLYGFVIRKIRH